MGCSFGDRTLWGAKMAVTHKKKYQNFWLNIFLKSLIAKWNTFQPLLKTYLQAFSNLLSCGSHFVDCAGYCTILNQSVLIYVRISLKNLTSFLKRFLFRILPHVQLAVGMILISKPCSAKKVSVLEMSLFILKKKKVS